MPQQLRLISIAILSWSLLACQPAADDVADQAKPNTPPVAVHKVVLVAGATGRTGRRLVARLAQRGYTVRAFVRNEETARERLGDDVQYAVGDVRDTQAVGAAFDGVDAVISAIGSSGRAQDPTNTPEAVDYNGVRNLVDAAVQGGVSQFVLVSSMGVTIEDHPLNQMFDNVLKWKFKGEQHLRSSGIPYTVVRPGGLTEEPGGESAVKIMVEDGGEGFIPRADVATICVEALENEEAINKTFSVLSDTQPPTDNWAQRFAAIPAD